MMRMTKMTQSQRIGIALPSDLPSERSTDSTIDSIHRPSFVQAESLVCSGSRVCVHCGAKMGAFQVRPLRTREFILNCLCVVLLIGVFLVVGYLLHSWAEHGFDDLFDHWRWHEPLNDWNL
jgi:hypothetical protein